LEKASAIKGPQHQARMPDEIETYASCFLPVFFAAAHLFFIANARRFRPSALITPRREDAGAAARFGAEPAPLARLTAQRLLVASMILLRLSGLRRLFRGLPSTLGVTTPAEGLSPVASRRANMARSMADRCFSSLEMTFSMLFTQVPFYAVSARRDSPRGSSRLI